MGDHSPSVGKGARLRSFPAALAPCCGGVVLERPTDKRTRIAANSKRYRSRRSSGQRVLGPENEGGQAQCPLWVISGHLRCKRACPLYPRKRTCAAQLGMSAMGHHLNRSSFSSLDTSPALANIRQRNIVLCEPVHAALARPSVIIWCRRLSLEVAHA